MQPLDSYFQVDACCVNSLKALLLVVNAMKRVIWADGFTSPNLENPGVFNLA